MAHPIGLPSHFEYAAERIAYSPDGCWHWTGYVGEQGYGEAKVAPLRQSAHRFLYMLHCGPIPADLELDHLCRVRHCVNPEHLEPVSARENTLRGMSPPALQARQTHCIRGHEFTPGNTYIRSTGARTCKACHKEYSRAYMREWSRRKRATQS